jgi:hypothetical protein
MIISCTTCFYKEALIDAKAKWEASPTEENKKNRSKRIAFCHECLRSWPKTTYTFEKLYSEYGYCHWTPYELLEKELFEI